MRRSHAYGVPAAIGGWWMVEGLSGDLEVRRRATAAMMHVPLEAIPEVIDRLRYSDSAPAFALIDHLNTLEKRDREAGLVAFALGRHDLSIREAALASLAASIDTDSAPVLISALSRTDPADADFLRLLSGLGSKGVPSLLEGLGRPHRNVRAGCIEALGAMKCDAALGGIADSLCAREPIVRVAAAKALGEMGSAEAIPALLASIRDRSWEVREASATALGRLKAFAAADELTRLVEDPHSEVSTAARTALEAFNPADAST